jgi:hypothetical protein
VVIPAFEPYTRRAAVDLEGDGRPELLFDILHPEGGGYSVLHVEAGAAEGIGYFSTVYTPEGDCSVHRPSPSL